MLILSLSKNTHARAYTHRGMHSCMHMNIRAHIEKHNWDHSVKKNLNKILENEYTPISRGLFTMIKMDLFQGYRLGLKHIII